MNTEAAPDETSEPGREEQPSASEETRRTQPDSGLKAAFDWIGKNPSFALVGAFAVGVFIGVLMRD